MQKELSARMAPVEALRAWLLLFVEYLATKQILWPAISQSEDSRSAVANSTRGVVENAVGTLAERAVESGDLRAEVVPMDLLRAVYGMSVGETGSGWTERARKMVDILIHGSRP
jgi:transcriptional regulator SbtR-like protein